MTSTALVTGASGGIGMELARIHAEKGGNLVLVARSQDKLEQLKEELEDSYGVSVIVHVEDLSQPDAAQKIFEATEAQGLVIDTLINNAGFGGHGRFHERELAKEQAMIQVNITTLTNLTHLYLQGMVARRQGRILNVSSTASFLPGPLQAVYFATKAYVTSFTQAVAEEVRPHNVTLTALCPGAVLTGFIEAADLEGLAVWKTAKSARSVAECGYSEMEKGTLVAFNQGSLKFALNWLVPAMPRKSLLKLVRSGMEKKH